VLAEGEGAAQDAVLAKIEGEDSNGLDALFDKRSPRSNYSKV
jgi:hypothetical protein